MPTATFRFYAELNDLLPRRRRQADFQAPFKDKISVKDMIESFGVPHTEVDLILANGKSVEFSYTVEDGDCISVYPIFETLNIRNSTRLRRAPLRRTRFIADRNIGVIVRLMRTLGFDVYFDPILSSREIIEVSNRDKRIILTRSRNLLKFKDITHAILIQPASSLEEVRRIVRSLDIRDQAKPFSRCPQCNDLLTDIDKEDALNRIPVKTRRLHDTYFQCPSSGKLYWSGTRIIRMKKAVDKVLGQNSSLRDPMALIQRNETLTRCDA